MLLPFMIAFSRRYLAAGGPTSRLEDRVALLGAKFDSPTEVFGTPTGIFITCGSQTAVARIRSTSIHLGELCVLERLMSDVLDGKITVSVAMKALEDPAPRAPLAYSEAALGFAALISGFAISFMAYRHLFAAAMSALITLLVWLLTDSKLSKRIPNAIFRSFLGAFVALGAASICHLAVSVSIEAYSIGAIVLLVPGLLITTAITELAEQNLVSGTAKLMQGILVVMAIGLAYLLFDEISRALQLQSVLLPNPAPEQKLIVSALGMAVTVWSFGVIFKAPARTLPFCTLTGLAGWSVLHWMGGAQLSVAGPYLACVTVGLLSLGLGKFFELPSQVYSVPGIVAALPGMLALSSFRQFALGDQDYAVGIVFQVMITAFGIVIGLLTARIPFQIFNKYKLEGS